MQQKYMHKKTARQIEKLLVMLAVKGEEPTFFYIRNVVKPTCKNNKTW